MNFSFSDFGSYRESFALPRPRDPRYDQGGLSGESCDCPSVGHALWSEFVPGRLFHQAEGCVSRQPERGQLSEKDAVNVSESLERGLGLRMGSYRDQPVCESYILNAEAPMFFP